MPSIIELPVIVKQALEQFGSLFPYEPERQHLGEYLTGLIVADKKNVSAINRQFPQAGDQSCLNRWLTEVDWDVVQLNERRLEWLQKNPSCRYSDRGVIAIDNVLIDHAGGRIADAGYFWDHADQRYKIAQDYLIANYVCTSGKHYPLEFHRFVKRDQCEADGREFTDHNQFFRQLVDWTVQHDIPGDFAFDCWFTHAENLNHINALDRTYVGDLKFNRKVIFQGRQIKAADVAAEIPPADRKRVTIKNKTQWYFTHRIRIPNVDHPVRLTILWKRRNGAEACKILVGNRTNWEISRTLGVYRHRWNGTECFHRDGKQNLGMGDCQLRSGLGQTRHMYLVFLAYSLLMQQLGRNRVSDWATERLTTIGQACQAVLKQTFRQTIDWVIERARVDQWNGERIKEHLALT